MKKQHLWLKFNENNVNIAVGGKKEKTSSKAYSLILK